MLPSVGFGLIMLQTAALYMIWAVLDLPTLQPSSEALEQPRPVERTLYAELSQVCACPPAIGSGV